MASRSSLLIVQLCFLEGQRVILEVAMELVHGKYCLSMLEKRGSAYYDSSTNNLIIRRYRVTQPSLLYSSTLNSVIKIIQLGMNLNMSSYPQLDDRSHPIVDEFNHTSYHPNSDDQNHPTMDESKYEPISSK